MTNRILKTNDGIKILMSNMIKKGEKAKIINGYVTMMFQKVIKKFFEKDALAARNSHTDETFLPS